MDGSQKNLDAPKARKGYGNLNALNARKGYFYLARPKCESTTVTISSPALKELKPKNYLSIFLWYLQLLCIAFKRLKGSFLVLTLLTLVEGGYKRAQPPVS